MLRAPLRLRGLPTSALSRRSLLPSSSIYSRPLAPTAPQSRPIVTPPSTVTTPQRKICLDLVPADMCGYTLNSYGFGVEFTIIDDK